MFEDRPPVVGSQLKRSSGERRPEKVRSQPERLQMARSTTKEGSLGERIAQRGARVNQVQNFRGIDTTL